MNKLEIQFLKDEVIRLRGYWHRFHEGLLDWCPTFLRAYLAFQTAPWRSGHIEPKVREFIYIAVDGAVTHLYTTGLRRHMDNALRLGATKEELLQVVLLTASAAAHATHEVGFSILAEEFPNLVKQPLSKKSENLKNKYIQTIGSWPEGGDTLLSVCPEFAEGFLDYRQAAWTAGPLSPKVKELILMAVNAAPTLLNRDGVRQHMKQAIRHGASAEEIGDILQLASAIAVHVCTYSVPSLMEAIDMQLNPENDE